MQGSKSMLSDYACSSSLSSSIFFSGVACSNCSRSVPRVLSARLPEQVNNNEPEGLQRRENRHRNENHNQGVVLVKFRSHLILELRAILAPAELSYNLLGTRSKALEVGGPQSAFRSRASSRQVAQDIQDVKCSDLQRLRPLVEIESPNQENDLKAQATVIRNLDQALP